MADLLDTPLPGDPLDLTGQVAIITGGGTGIGAATARLLSSHGATTVLAGRTASTLHAVAGQRWDNAFALEWGDRGIRANAVAVGPVASEGALRSWERAGILERLRAMAGTPDDIAWTVLFRASPASRFINGETIMASGTPLAPS